MDQDAERFDFSRRGVLKSGSGFALATGTAGCNEVLPSQVKSYEFNAAPVGLKETPDSLEYHETDTVERTIERERNLLDTEFNIKLTNYGSVYQGGRDTLGLLASPLAKVPGAGAQNPLADTSLKKILTGTLGDRLLATANVIDKQKLTWSRGPTAVVTRKGTLLGQSTTIRSFAGLLEGGDFVLITMTRVRDAGDAVYATTVLQQELKEAPKSLLGENGVLKQSTVTSTVDRFETLLRFVKRTAVGLRILASSHVITDGPSENYVRVVVRNDHDEKVLYSVGLLMQVFDQQGTFLDIQVAGIDRLGPKVTFEGHIPYYSFGEDTAAYAIESHYTTRDVAAETVDDIRLKNHRFEDGQVTGTVRNTGTGAAKGFTVRVTFFDENNTVLGSASRQFAGLPEGGTQEFEADIDEAETMPGKTATDYSVQTIRYNRQPLYVR